MAEEYLSSLSSPNCGYVLPRSNNNNDANLKSDVLGSKAPSLAAPTGSPAFAMPSIAADKAMDEGSNLTEAEVVSLAFLLVDKLEAANQLCKKVRLKNA